MMRICGRRDVGTAIICRSCWDNAERRGGGIVGGGGDTETSFDETRVFSTECFPILRGIVIVTGIVIFIFSSTHLLDPGVLSLCRRFLNQFDTWKVKSKKNELNLIWFEPVWHLETKTRMRKQCKCGSKVFKCTFPIYVYHQETTKALLARFKQTHCTNVKWNKMQHWCNIDTILIQYGYNMDAVWIRYGYNTCVSVRPVFFARVLFSSGVGYLIYQNT